MSKRDQRKKASDVFNESNLMLGPKVGFDEAFPEIEDVTVEVKENGEGVHGSGSRIYRKGQFGEYIDCSNPLCYNGGFSIGSILREMVRNRQTELEESRKCQGYEGSPRGRCVYRDCWNSFEIRVSVKFKRDQTDINNQ